MLLSTLKHHSRRKKSRLEEEELSQNVKSEELQKRREHPW
jgi:hypothetical protein